MDPGPVFAMKQKGFTLIELLVVVAIIGILAAVGVVAYSGYTASAKKAAAKSNHKTAIKVIQAKFAECDINGEILLKSKQLWEQRNDAYFSFFYNIRITTIILAKTQR